MARVTKRYNPNAPRLKLYIRHDGVDPSSTGFIKPHVYMRLADPSLQKAGSCVAPG